MRPSPACFAICRGGGETDGHIMWEEGDSESITAFVLCSAELRWLRLMEYRGGITSYWYVLHVYTCLIYYCIAHVFLWIITVRMCLLNIEVIASRPQRSAGLGIVLGVWLANCVPCIIFASDMLVRVFCFLRVLAFFFFGVYCVLAYQVSYSKVCSMVYDVVFVSISFFSCFAPFFPRCFFRFLLSYAWVFCAGYVVCRL